MYRSVRISCSIGGLILLRPSTFDWVILYSLVPRFASRTLSVLVACFFSCLSSVQAEPLRVHVALSEPGGAYVEFGDTLRGELESKAFEVSVGDAGDGNDAADLIVAVGMRAATQLTHSKKPVLNVLVPKAGYDKLPKSAIARRSSVIYLDQPMGRQIALVQAVLPKITHIGVLYSAPPAGLANLRRLVRERNLLLHESVVDTEHTLADALEDVLEGSEALLVLPDTDVYNADTIRNILLASYRKQVPLIGISLAYVKAGALCAIYSTPEQIALQTAEEIRQFAATGILPPGQYPEEFDVSVNRQVARSLDIPIKEATQLRNEVRSAP
jgi:putative ABC transport system substrate-binding protein